MFGPQINLLKTLLLLLSFILPILAQTLGLKQDENAKARGFTVWSSKATYDAPTDATMFSGAELYGLASQAWDEMIADLQAKGLERPDWPAMIAAMTHGNDVYFSSSLKGGAFMYEFNEDVKPEVLLRLKQCQVGLQESTSDEVNTQHRTRASCAEIMALHQFYSDPDVDQAIKDNPDKGLRVVAFGQPTISNPQIRIKPGQSQKPCGNAGTTTWGCKHFMEAENIDVPAKTKPVVKSPAPAPIGTTQVNIC